LIQVKGFFRAKCHNFGGALGAWLSTTLLRGFGYPAYILVLGSLAIGLVYLIPSQIWKKWRIFILTGILVMLFSILLNLAQTQFGSKLPTDATFRWGGALFESFTNGMSNFLGAVGSYLIILATIIVSLLLLTDLRLIELSGLIIVWLMEKIKKVRERPPITPENKDRADREESADRGVQLFPKEESEKKKLKDSPPPLTEKKTVVKQPVKPDENRYKDSSVSNFGEEEADSPVPIQTQSAFSAEELKAALVGNDEEDMPLTLNDRQSFPSETSVKIERPALVDKSGEHILLHDDSGEKSVSVEAVSEISLASANGKSSQLSGGKESGNQTASSAKILDERPCQIPSAENLLPNPPTDTIKNIPRIEIQDTSSRLESKLKEFGIVGKVTSISPGPVVTMYELRLAAGVKVNKILGLIDDLSMALMGRRVRIVAPIPGRDTIGVEVPNRNPEIVYFKDILRCSDYMTSEKPLLLALGKTISGEPFVTSLTSMPHLLIAGATGSGKSVCVNSILGSFLFKYSPQQLRMILIDPKMIELSVYNDIPHLLTPVVTDPKNAVAALKWAVMEMENRYRMLAKYNARNIIDFNVKIEKMRKNEGEVGQELEKLNYIVVVIDEFADLMMTASGDIEESIARLAQMARAVGMHLILATQRPSVNVITGVIKANFPTRIAFQVAQRNDSRTILDMNGAESLLGKGDMLFLPPGKPLPYRIHGAYISTEETEKLVAHWQQYPVHYESIFDELEEENSDNGLMGGERDALFFKAARLVIMHQQGSSSMLQRRLNIGFPRASRIIEQLQQSGIVGPDRGSKVRDVLVDSSYLDMMEQ